MFSKIESGDDIIAVVNLAKEIWEDHFTPLIGSEQVEYMLSNYQSINSITKQIQDENFSYYSVTNGDDLLGYFAYYPKCEQLYLSKFYLKKEARGAGFGRKVITFLESEARDMQAKSLELNVYKGNDHTISIYEKMGFRIVAEPQIDIGNGFILNDYVMQKEL